MKERILWGRLLRRAAALFLATLAVWVLPLCTGAGATSALRELGEDPGFVAAAQEAELGLDPGAGPHSALDTWGRLAVGQAPLRLANPAEGEGTEEEATLDLPAGQPARDLDDITSPPVTTAAPSDIEARTLVPTSPEGYDVAGGLYLYNRTSLDVDLAAAASASVNITLPDQGPQILIIHTHATEAYTPDGTDVYTH